MSLHSTFFVPPLCIVCHEFYRHGIGSVLTYQVTYHNLRNVECLFAQDESLAPMFVLGIPGTGSAVSVRTLFT